MVEESWRAIKEKEEFVKAYEKKLKTAEHRLGLMKWKYSEKMVKVIDLIESVIL